MVPVEDKSVSALRFAVPVAIESTATMLIGLVVSAVVGGISASSLVAVSTVTQLTTLLSSSLCMLSAGATVLIARYAGARDLARTSNAVEQTLLLTVLFSCALSVLVLLLSVPILHLLMPNAEDSLFSEGLVYMRVVLCSFPALMLYTLLCGILRATGNARAPMVVSIVMNVVQLLFALLFLQGFSLGILGAGLALALCRLVGAGALLFVVLYRSSSIYHVHLPNLRTIDTDFLRRVLRIGMPSSIETVSVQAGYVVANSITIGLGTYAASVAQVANTLNAFPAVVHTIAMAVQMPVVASHIGAKRPDLAKKSANRIWVTCVTASLALSLLLALLSNPLVRFYTKDPSVAQDAVWLVWTLPLYHLFGASINSVDPALKAGGEQKYVMLQSILGVWLLRVPLSWLFGYVFHWGIRGVFFANYIALAGRAIPGLLVRARGRWIHEEL